MSHKPTTEPTIEPLLVSRKDAAKALSISTRALDYLIAEGRLRTRKIGGRVLVAWSALKSYANHDDRQRIRPLAQAS